MTLLDAPALTQRALAAVDDAIRAATAPDGLLDQHIGASISLAVSLAVTSTLDEIFVSYRSCVLEERHAAKAALTSSLLAARSLPKWIFRLLSPLPLNDTLNATLRSAASEFAAKRKSMVNAITHA